MHFANQAAGAPESFLTAVLALLLSIPIGALSYLLSLWLLWRVAGRPESVITMLGRRALEMLKQRLGKAPASGA